MSMRLLNTELRRYFSRRVMVGGLLAGLFIVLGVNIFQLARSSTSPDLNDALTVGVPQKCLVRMSGPTPIYSGACVDGLANGPFEGQVEEHIDHGGRSFGVGVNNGAELKPALIERAQDRRLHISATFSKALKIIGAPMVFLSILLASSFLAADFGTSIGTQLMFEPRRRLTYLTKTLAVMIGAALITLALAVFAFALQYIGSATRGITTGMDGHWFGLRLADTGRIMLAAAIAAPLGLAVAALTKRTVAAVGMFFGMYIVLGVLGGTSWGRPIAKYLPINSLTALAVNEFGPNTNWFGIRTMLGALMVASIIALALTALTSAWFERREMR